MSETINATIVAAFECPACSLIMIRGEQLFPRTTYHCYNSDCEQHKVRYYAPQISMGICKAD